MRVITTGTLRGYMEQYPHAAAALRAWYRLTLSASWRSLAETRATLRHADQYGCCKIFNIRGNHFRLITHVDYRFQLVFLRHFLSHPEYDEEDWRNDC